MVEFEDIKKLAAKKGIKAERVEGYPDWCLLVMPRRNDSKNMLCPTLLTTAEDILLDRKRRPTGFSVIPIGRRKNIYDDWVGGRKR